MSAGHGALCIIFCPDGRILKNRLEALYATQAKDTAGLARHVFWGDEGLGEAFWEHLTLQGLLAQAKFLVVRNAQNLLKDHWDKLAPQINALAELPAAGTTPRLILCCEGAFERGAPKVPQTLQKLPAYERARQKGLVEIIPGLTPNSLPGFIKSEAARLGLSLSPDQIRSLAGLLPADGFAASAELSKLALLADATGKPPADALRGLESPETITAFSILRTMQQGDAAKVWRGVAECSGGDSGVFGFLAILRGEAGVLWQLLMGETPGRAWDLENKKKAASRLGPAGVASMWDLALAAEKGIKSGERTPEQAFDMLTADLFRLFLKAGICR